MVSEILGYFFAWTWPIWAIVFVVSMVSAISRTIQEAGDGRDRGSVWSVFWAALSFAVILGGITSLIVMIS